MEVNKQYQEVIKVVITLVTASLVLPIVFLTNVLGLKPEELEGYLNFSNNHQAFAAYVAWVFLVVSLLACVGFYYCSTKFTKAVYGLYDDASMENRMEGWRDKAGGVATACAVVGFLFLFYFLLHSAKTAPKHAPISNAISIHVHM